MPSVSGLQLYPRGFLGAISQPRIEPVASQPQLDQSDVINTLLARQFHVNRPRPSDDASPANWEVEALYSDYAKQLPQTLSFDFRTQVLAVAMRAFGTVDFAYWVREQRRSLAYSDLHRRFIHDMLRQIDGKRPELSITTWTTLLRVDSNAVLRDSYPDPVVEEFFKTRLHLTNLPSVIQNWCSQEGGFDNLLATLHLLFGDF